MAIELLASRLAGRLWAASVEDGRAVELHAEPNADHEQAGRILKARVSNLIPGIQSAFLDVGGDRGAFLHADELVLPGDPPDAGPPRPEGGESRPPIEQRIAIGRELLVQVTRESIRAKGPRVTCRLSLAGRFLVLLPHLGANKVSRRIRDPLERERLIEELSRCPERGIAYLARTAAAGVGGEALQEEARRLLEEWRLLQARAGELKAPAVVRREPDLLLRLLRDLPGSEVERIVFDHPRDYQRALDFLGPIDPELARVVRPHRTTGPLFDEYELFRQFHRAMRPLAWLRSGGHVVIESTEAMISIDVNTGKYSGRSTLEETALRTNLEAAAEIPRQLRLRNLGGIVVIDFIDMALAENREKVMATLESGLAGDRARIKIVGMSELGLVQVARERTRTPLADALMRPCSPCGAPGRVKQAHYVAVEALAEARRRYVAGQRIVIRTPAAVAQEMVAASTDPAWGEPQPGCRVVEDPAVAVDAFTVLPE